MYIMDYHLFSIVIILVRRLKVDRGILLVHTSIELLSFWQFICWPPRWVLRHSNGSCMQEHCPIFHDGHWHLWFVSHYHWLMFEWAPWLEEPRFSYLYVLIIMICGSFDDVFLSVHAFHGWITLLVNILLSFMWSSPQLWSTLRWMDFTSIMMAYLACWITIWRERSTLAHVSRID
jgi:hypothetical protein